MIEDATIFVEGKPYPTRLHEHGREPPLWLETGYMEGAEATLTALKNSGRDSLEFFRNGVLVATMIGVVWGEVVNMYDDHWIMHLDWKVVKNRK